MHQPPPGPSQWVWAPLASALPLVLVAALAVVTHRVFLFASLGPTAVMAAQHPQQRSSQAYNALAGHLIGFVSGCVLVLAFGLAAEPSVFQMHDVSLSRAAASIVALAVAAGLELPLRAQHPPAASTTLLVTLGSFHPTWGDAELVLGGVLLVTAVTELLRRLRLRHLARAMP